MAIEIVQTTTCDAPVDCAFDYVAEHRNVPHWIFGISSFTPVGELEHGLGAVFDATMSLGMTLKSRLKVDEWVDNRLISFDSVKGFNVSLRWNFESTGLDSTVVTAQISYSLPFGPAGKAMGKVIGPFVKQAVSKSSDQLKAAVEARATA